MIQVLVHDGQGVKKAFACVFVHAGKKIGKETLLERLPQLDNRLGLFGQQQLDFPAIARLRHCGSDSRLQRAGKC